MGTISHIPAALEAAGRSFGALRLAGTRVGATLGTAVVAVLNWQRRANERFALQSLDDRMLRDIGITHADADREARKPFWIA